MALHKQTIAAKKMAVRKHNKYGRTSLETLSIWAPNFKKDDTSTFKVKENENIITPT